MQFLRLLVLGSIVRSVEILQRKCPSGFSLIPIIIVPFQISNIWFKLNSLLIIRCLFSIIVDKKYFGLLVSSLYFFILYKLKSIFSVFSKPLYTFERYVYKALYTFGENSQILENGKLRVLENLNFEGSL